MVGVRRMTEEELKKKAEEYATEQEKNCILGVYDNTEDLQYDEGYNRGYVIGLEEGYIAGAKENQPTEEEMLKRLVKGGYVKSGIRDNKEDVFWHDLRKNPKDLPPKDVGTFSTFVITNKGIGYYVDCQNKWFVYWNVTGSYECSTEVVAWCELPKFEEEEC